MADVLDRVHDAEDAVMINGRFVREQAQAAFRKYFRPLTVVFEPARGSPHEPAPTIVPKAPRVQIRGYAIKKRRTS